MAKITIDELQKILRENNTSGSTPFIDDGDHFFLEICFEKKEVFNGVIDDEYKDAVLSVETDFGSALILFNEFGRLKSIEIS